MMLNRSNDVELDFDFDKVKEKTKDNPVFYVQYAYARINSLLRTLNLKLNNKVDLDVNDLNLNYMEEKIIRKVFEWPKIVSPQHVNLNYIKFLFIYMNFLHYFMHIGVRETKMKITSL